MTRTPVIRVVDCHVARETPDSWQYLVLLRAPGHLDAGRWRVVTGKIEDGETAWQAALRELSEETGLKARRLLAVPYVNQFYEWQHDRINAIPVFVAIVGAGDVELNHEHTEHRWLAADDAAALLAWPAQRDGLLAAHALLSGYHQLVEALEVDLGADSGADLGDAAHHQ